MRGLRPMVLQFVNAKHALKKRDKRIDARETIPED